ncbi:YqiA/YcfP family alpha/beta fold hydrolase [Paucibacter sp. APW11]|uniref:YqiA/YcfP family alpha/beta fold hydrolase n=1 Tax=Roseateles aquae TaxID=3077235 RepID=A0ABU3PF64_9BURK|nr:YqiA/YcfP family alpha/beta fold hydrolase [Paucibacter sp. APW11]MDT9001169.1 YqiA/YcfP family alpha/beta fold hydrolase [Paucibacter sp. APW11]
MTATHLLYLHGFRSSPQSAKARRMARWVAEQRPDLQWLCPQLPPSPRQAMGLINALLSDCPHGQLAVMGSSLGGFYASVVAQSRPDALTVLLNPAVDPARDLARYIGEHSCWQKPEERFFFRAEYVDELSALQPGEWRHPERMMAVIAKGDEVLDWREMQARYARCRIKLLEGSDHGLSDFDDYLDELLTFLQL